MFDVIKIDTKYLNSVPKEVETTNTWIKSEWYRPPINKPWTKNSFLAHFTGISR